MRKFITMLMIVALAASGLAACGDDDDTDDAAAAAAAAAEFCAKSAELDAGDGPPTNEQFEELRDIAPEAIRADVDLAVDRIIEVGLMQAFGDPEVNAAIENIEAWEEENCPERADRDEDDEGEAVPQTPDPDATVVNVTATDYAFSIEGSVPGGKVAFVMTNAGDEPHHVDIVRFKDEFSEEEVRQALESGSDDLFGMIDDDTELAEHTTSVEAEPGGETVLNVDLPPGIYGLACFVSDPEGVPHFFHGMWTVFTIE